MTYFKTHFNTPAETKLDDLDPIHFIIVTIIFNLLVPTNDHRTNANKMEFYLLYCVIKKICIDFGFVMCRFLLRLSTNTHRKLSYIKFLKLIFKHFNVPFTGSSPKENFTCFFTKNYFKRKNIKFVLDS